MFHSNVQSVEELGGSNDPYEEAIKNLEIAREKQRPFLVTIDLSKSEDDDKCHNTCMTITSGTPTALAAMIHVSLEAVPRLAVAFAFLGLQKSEGRLPNKVVQ